MLKITPLIPRQPVPNLKVATVGGGTWTLSEQTPENFILLIFFRGLHCPICSTYLRELQRRLDEFAEAGVTCIAVSPDSKARAEIAVEEWGLEYLTLGYGISIDTARKWGLFVSTGRGSTSSGVKETRLFSEPGLFLIRPDGTLYFSSVQTMPFARPSFEDILKGVRFVIDKNYPARGQVVDHENPEQSSTDWPQEDYDPE